MAGQFDGKVALVTGAASGIGRATALAFAREGARVAVADVSVESGEETVGMIERHGGKAAFIRVDVTAPEQVEEMVSKTVEAYGRLDCAHNNAGIGGIGVPTDQHTEEDFDRTMAINVKGVWLGMKYQIPQMLKQGGGAIVNTASVVGLVGAANLSAYVASKHAVVGLTKSAALEYARKGVRVNCICPGIVRTPLNENYWAQYPGTEEESLAMEPIGRFARPEEMADGVLWLCSDEASFVHGHPMAIDGGYSAQ
jgi:NAD(P)-dependent dehydrogenase (short-subunit alcohol dehydrogenase family)